jgi:hypothetical protein
MTHSTPTTNVPVDGPVLLSSQTPKPPMEASTLAPMNPTTHSPMPKELEPSPVVLESFTSGGTFASPFDSFHVQPPLPSPSPLVCQPQDIFEAPPPNNNVIAEPEGELHLEESFPPVGQPTHQEMARDIKYPLLHPEHSVPGLCDEHVCLYISLCFQTMMHSSIKYPKYSIGFSCTW